MSHATQSLQWRYARGQFLQDWACKLGSFSNCFSTSWNQRMLATFSKTDKLLVYTNLSFWSDLRVWFSSFSGQSFAQTAPLWETDTANWPSCCDHTLCAWLRAIWVLQSIVEKFFSAERFPSQSCQLSLWPPPPHPLGAEDWTQDFLLANQTLYHWARSPTTPFNGFCHSLP